MISTVGLDDFNLEIVGKVSDDKFRLEGHVVEDPSREIIINGIRRAYLP